MKNIIITIMLAMSLHAWAQENSPTGLWKMLDEQTGKPKALIRISVYLCLGADKRG